MIHKNSKREIRNNKKMLKKGEKIFCINCYKRYQKPNGDCCIAYPLRHKDTYLSRETEYKKCCDINRNNNCLEFSQISYDMY